MKEPEITPDWNSLSFRDRPAVRSRREGSIDIFWIGIGIFLLTALIHPWYAYRVQSFLVAREMAAAARVAEQEFRKVGQEVQRQFEAGARAAEASAAQARMAGVSVRGTSVVQGHRVVVVSLGTASLGEAKASICFQASRSFRQPLVGERLRIQSSNGNRPARDVGWLTCD